MYLIVALLCYIVFYQRGDLAKSLIRVPDELPAGWDQDDVEALLRKYVLNSTT